MMQELCPNDKPFHVEKSKEIQALMKRLFKKRGERTV